MVSDPSRLTAASRAEEERYGNRPVLRRELDQAGLHRSGGAVAREPADQLYAVR